MVREIVAHVIDKTIIITYIIFLFVNWYIIDTIIYELINRHGAIILSNVVSWILGFIWLTNLSIFCYIIYLVILNRGSNRPTFFTNI
jgi:hypothetical protein